MRKIIIGIILTMVLATGCGIKAYSDSNNKSPEPEVKDFICFERVSHYDTKYRHVYRDKFTDVLYLEIKYSNATVGITPIAKSDGTFLTYTEWKEKYSKTEQSQL